MIRRSRSIPVLLCAVLLGALAAVRVAAEEAPAGAAQPLTPAQLYKRCLPSVLTLKVKYADDTDGFGTGFLSLKDGCAVTAWHVVKNAASVTARFADGEEFEVSGVVDRDEKRDLALIRVKVAARPMLTLVPGDPEVGARAYAIGAPQGLEFSLSDGLISQIRTEEGVKRYQFSSPISSGNSGGPLILEDGRVTGVVRSRVTEGQNLNFAVPAVYAMGLDATLPTKPWEQLVVPAEMTTTPEKIREPLHMAVLALLDASEVLDRAEAEVATVEGAYRKGVPAYLDQCKGEMAAVQKLLSQLKSQNVKHPLIEPLEMALEAYTNSLGLYVDSVKRAVQDNGWSKEASDLHTEALAKWDTAATAEKAVYDVLTGKQVAEDLANLFVLAVGTIYDAATDEAGWELGIRMLASEPMVVFRIKPDGWAQKLDFLVGDEILSIDRRPVEALFEIKEILEEKVGEYVFITVKRNGKEETYSRKVPPIMKTKS
jgi:S1-C subfamily serine protease